jgi:hypothetical protein
VTRGTRPKKPSSSRGFAREARGAWGVRGFWGLKTENCKLFISFQAGNNYQKKIIKIYNFFYFYFLFYFLFYFFASAWSAEGREGEEGGREREGREGEGGEGGASARTQVFYPQVTSERTL